MRVLGRALLVGCLASICSPPAVFAAPILVDGSEGGLCTGLVAETTTNCRVFALAFPGIGNRDCAATLMGAEAEARRGKKGTWAEPTAIKNAESPDDILAGIGRFTVVEGRVLSVRQAGTTTYLNFGRNWTRDFAVTISRRILPAFASAGIPLKSLENRRIRVRGWIEGRPGPRINVLRVGQIEMLGDN